MAAIKSPEKKSELFYIHEQKIGPFKRTPNLRRMNKAYHMTKHTSVIYPWKIFPGQFTLSQKVTNLHNVTNVKLETSIFYKFWVIVTWNVTF
jgi:hypothetical protein